MPLSWVPPLGVSAWLIASSEQRERLCRWRDKFWTVACPRCSLSPYHTFLLPKMLYTLIKTILLFPFHRIGGLWPTTEILAGVHSKHEPSGWHSLDPILPPSLVWCARDLECNPACSLCLFGLSCGFLCPHQPASPALLGGCPRFSTQLENLERKLMFCACLLAAQKRESGVWLNALPLSAIGLWMDGDTVQVAMGLCLGVPLCLPHDCQHCRTKVNSLGTHGLSCHRGQGRHSCHEGINALIQRHLSSAGIPAQIEPMGVSVWQLRF